jgi:REP element-mobilizing transposase RayT
VTVASLVQRLKGASAYEWNHAPRRPHLAWQAGSWVESLSPALLPAAIRYVEHQREHHGETTAPEPWEASLASSAGENP